jgi:hypothetical protein
MKQDLKILFNFWKKLFFMLKKIYTAQLLYVIRLLDSCGNKYIFPNNRKERSRFIKPSSVNFVILGPNVSRLFYETKSVNNKYVQQNSYFLM